ncbi:MAG: flavodoxin family protein [Clostridia bacterium]|nr:flavodoxin family protein [Clostridia bacterium]
MNILAINGSGRPSGNNYNILTACLESFNKDTCSTELIYLGHLKIGACKSCYNCKNESGKCIIEDDMTHITKKIMESDLLIISSPIYMWQISAETKLFMERLYPLYHFDRPPELKGKKLILIFTQATPDREMFKAYFEHIKDSMSFLGFDVDDVVVIPGLRKANDYANYPDMLNKIAVIGNRDWKL